MYKNTKFFWVTIVAVAILSMFHSSVSLGNAATLSGYSKCPLKIDATNPYRPKWSWDMDDTIECKYQLDDGDVVECFKGFFQPDREILSGTHTFHVNFTCADGVKESFQVRYETSTAKMTEIDRPDASMQVPANGGKRQGVPPPAPAGSQRAPLPPAPNGEQGEVVQLPPAHADGPGTTVPPVTDQNACDDKPPRKFTLSGKIVDADTNQGISGAQFMVLVPGTLIYEYDAFLDSSSILSQAVTEKSGNYTLSRQLRNGRKYSMFISAVSYERYKLNEELMKTCNESLTMDFMLRPLH